MQKEEGEGGMRAHEEARQAEENAEEQDKEMQRTEDPECSNRQ